MYCIIKCIVQGKQARVKNTDLRHPSCSCNVKTQICVTCPQRVKMTLIECGVMQDGTQYYTLQIQKDWDVTCCHWMDNSQQLK